MLKMSLKDFKAEVEAEMAGYEEISQEQIKDWLEHLDKYVKHVKDNNKVVLKGNQVEIKLDDESELFSIVDRFFAAVMNEDLEAYYTDWNL